MEANPYDPPLSPHESDDETASWLDYLRPRIVDIVVLAVIAAILIGLLQPAAQSNCRPRSRSIPPAGR